jgi:hypothetical protein
MDGLAESFISKCLSTSIVAQGIGSLANDSRMMRANQKKPKRKRNASAKALLHNNQLVQSHQHCTKRTFPSLFSNSQTVI